MSRSGFCNHQHNPSCIPYYIRNHKKRQRWSVNFEEESRDVISCPAYYSTHPPSCHFAAKSILPLLFLCFFRKKEKKRNYFDYRSIIFH